MLSTLEKILVCVAYDVDGERCDEMPMTQTGVHHAVPIYEELPGWSEDITGARTLADLLSAARAYLNRIEELSGTRISAVSVRPRQDETIVASDLAG